jgi:hypothetical protein
LNLQCFENIKHRNSQIIQEKLTEVFFSAELTALFYLGQPVIYEGKSKNKGTFQKNTFILNVQK